MAGVVCLSFFVGIFELLYLFRFLLKGAPRALSFTKISLTDIFMHVVYDAKYLCFRACSVYRCAFAFFSHHYLFWFFLRYFDTLLSCSCLAYGETVNFNISLAQDKRERTTRIKCAIFFNKYRVLFTRFTRFCWWWKSKSIAIFYWATALNEEEIAHTRFEI